MIVRTVAAGSLAEQAGLMPGDVVTAINGGPARDDIDFMYYGADDEIHLAVERIGEEMAVSFDGGADPGIEFEPMKYMCCGNKCIFCFVDQNPRSMRSHVYFKDEDYRLSFLHGAYVTLTALNESHLIRIEEQHLSPLYISVHSTNPAVRRHLLGIRRDDHLMERINRLVGAGIKLHTQVVVCPGVNDGDILLQTIGDLSELYPGVASLAVVPVGLTRHREKLVPLKSVDKSEANETIDAVDRFRHDWLAHHDVGFVYCADEWYIKADREIPGADYYDDFSQLENGVGMVRDFIDALTGVENRLQEAGYRTGKYVLVTGASMSVYIGDLAGKLSSLPGLTARVVSVPNRFYGESVTVSGLLTGGDIIGALNGIDGDEMVVLPPNCLNDSGLFLDDKTPGDIETALGVKVIQGSYDPSGVFVDH
ncbi:DUF512 domain-containing protein [Candidatus Latescibacterota bacterium]